MINPQSEANKANFNEVAALEIGDLKEQRIALNDKFLTYKNSWKFE